MIKVLTIEREYGSGAAMIAQRLAEKLGWKLWDQAITDEVARYLECDRRHVEQQEERRDPLHYRLLKSFLRGSFEGSLNAPKMKIADADGIRKVTEQLVRKAADEGNAVIVGRGASVILGARADVLRVFMYAPREWRIARVIKATLAVREAVENEVDRVDRARAAYIRDWYGLTFGDPRNYDLCIDTSRLQTEQSTASIAAAVRARTT